MKESARERVVEVKRKQQGWKAWLTGKQVEVTEEEVAQHARNSAGAGQEVLMDPKLRLKLVQQKII